MTEVSLLCSISTSCCPDLFLPFVFLYFLIHLGFFFFLVFVFFLSFFFFFFLVVVSFSLGSFVYLFIILFVFPLHFLLLSVYNFLEFSCSPVFGICLSIHLHSYPFYYLFVHAHFYLFIYQILYLIIVYTSIDLFVCLLITVFICSCFHCTRTTKLSLMDAAS